MKFKLNSVSANTLEILGSNTLYLLEKGKNVIFCDFAEETLKKVKNIERSKNFII